MSQEGNIWQALFSDYLFLVLTHVISVQQQLNSDAVHRLSLFHSAERSVEACLHCETWWDELCMLRKKRLKRRPPVTQVQVWHTFFKPSTASSCNSGSRGTVPLSSCSVACVLSSFYPSIGTILFMPSAAPSHLTSLLGWHSFFSEPLVKPLPLCLLFLLSLSRSLPVLVRACWWQIHLQALWTQLTFLLP